MTPHDAWGQQAGWRAAQVICDHADGAALVAASVRRCALDTYISTDPT